MAGIYLTVESAGESPQYTLTCISTGKSVSSFTWETWDPINYWNLVTYGRKHKVLNDPMTAQYTVTLTLTELELDTYYICDEFYDYFRYIFIEGKSILVTISIFRTSFDPARILSYNLSCVNNRNAITSALHASKNCSFCSFTLMFSDIAIFIL